MITAITAAKTSDFAKADFAKENFGSDNVGSDNVDRGLVDWWRACGIRIPVSEGLRRVQVSRKESGAHARLE